jgi:hypothetical protein
VVRPTVDLLEQIIFGEAILRERGELSAKHDRFWQQMLELPRTLGSLVKTPECTEFTAVYYADGIAPETLNLFPRIQDYANVPYLHVAAALLISFMADGDTALQVLQNAKPKLHIKDHFFLMTIAQLSYYQGKPGEMSGLYFGQLNELRHAARSRIELLESAGEKCSADGGLLCRQQISEFGATNAATYFLAEDLARGSEYAIPYAARLQEYAEEIKRWTDELDKLGAKKSGFYSFVQSEKYTCLDTYAYAELVLEARKRNPDHDLIKKKVVPIFRKVVEHFRENVDNEPHIDRSSPMLVQLRIAQEHLASAVAFVGE